MHTPLSEFIADLASTNWLKDNPQLLDENSIARWVYLELRGFGRNVMTQYEDVVHINNFRGEMPDNFASLNLAVYCEADFVSYPKGVDPIKVQTRLIGERITMPEITLCEDCTPIEDTTRCGERIIENLYLDATERIDVHYKNYNYVKLGPDLVRSHCSTDCINRNVKDSPYSINIKGTTIYSNFKKGSLYVRYYGLPMDEDCLPVIPDTPNKFLEKYLEVNVKRRILEDAMLSKDSTNQQTIFNWLVQQELDLYNKAKADTSGINMLAMFKAIGNNRKRLQKYNINLGTFRSNLLDSYSSYNGAYNPNSF